MRALVLAAAILSLLQQPTFRTGVDLIRLDVRVVDKDGRPVRDLRPEDFLVTLDGSARTVTSATFYGPEDAPPQRTQDVPVFVGSNTTSTTGRVVVIVADLESIDPGSEKPIFETTAALIDRLSPADAVGLLVIPGKSVELTRDHEKVRDALKQLRGWGSQVTSRYTMSVRDAEGFRNGDAMVIASVFERECQPPTNEMCQREIRDMAGPLLMDADRRTRMLNSTLTSLLEKLEPIEAPKSVLLLSAGLQRRFGDEQSFDTLRQRSASAGVSLSVVQIDQPEHDSSRRTLARRYTRADAIEGLSAIASATDATFYHGVANATGAFDRIRSEIVHSYLLGIESSPSDADGRRHKLKVEVRRPGVSVQARRELIVAKTRLSSTNPVEVLAQPIDFTELPVAVGLFTTRGTDPSALRVILLAELLTAKAGAGGPASYAFAIQQDGKNVFETADSFAAGASRAAVAAQLAPGRYRLRAAVVDGAGQRGSLDIPIIVGLRQAGELQFSDLIIGDTRPGTFLPMTRGSAATPVETALELYSADPAHLEGLTVTLEARRPGAADAVKVPAEVGKTDNERRRFASARIAAGALAPGTWLISAVIRRGDTVVGQITRTLGVE